VTGPHRLDRGKRAAKRAAKRVAMGAAVLACSVGAATAEVARAAPDDGSDFRSYGLFCRMRPGRGGAIATAAVAALASSGGMDRGVRARAFSRLADEARRQAGAPAPPGAGRAPGGGAGCRDDIDPAFLAWWFERMAEIEGGGAAPAAGTAAAVPGTVSDERCRPASDNRPAVAVEHCTETGIRLCPARAGSRWVLAWKAPCSSNIADIRPGHVFRDETGDGIDDVWMFFRDSHHDGSPDDYTSYYEWLLVFDGATGAPLLVGHTGGYHGELVAMDIEPLGPGRLRVRRLPIPISPRAEKLVRWGLPTLLAPGLYELDGGFFRRR
jgi:hypothetical protein